LWPREGIGGKLQFHRLSLHQVERAWEKTEPQARQPKEEEEEIKRDMEIAVTTPLPLLLKNIECIGYAQFLRESTTSKKLFHYQQDNDLAQELHNNLLLHLHGKFSKILAQEMFLEGLIISDNNSDVIEVKNILCDSGALHGSYMNKLYLNKIRHQLAPSQIRKVSSDVRLGDNKTIVSINEVVILDLVITLKESSTQKEYTVKEIFSVIDTGPDLIFGLPTIVRCIPDLFKTMIDKACGTLKILETVNDSLPDDSGNDLNRLEQLPDDYYENIIENPWSDHEQEAPEELECDLPVNFESALHFMEIGYEASVQEYKDLFESHIEKTLREDSEFMELLETKGVRVFVPQNWDGINFEPIELEFSKDMPDSMKVSLRPVNPKLFEHAKKEFERLKKYFYVDSKSSIVSNLVIAPKATKPFIRFCGDYVKVNQYISRIHAYIPQIQQELGKIQKFKIFLDLDMTNSFHQFKLGPRTSEKLSVLTPWGCVKPIFLPEGVSPATSILQLSIRQLFAEFEEWSICVFDNFLILANDIPDATKKLETFLDKCIEYNIYLKFSKSWMGFKEIKFFGYVCSHESYRLEDSRLDSIREIPFPSSTNKAVNTKKIQSFLGAALFFQPFVQNYSDKAAPLNDLVHKNFSWDRSTWKIDYVQKFEDFKSALMEMVTLYYPNYELEWIVQTDASEYGVGGTLMQIYVRHDGIKEKQPLFFVSAKFSAQAFKWSMIEKECYGIYFTVKKLAYYLSGKTFILETDHQNLIWIEASLVPKIIRWRIYLQSYMIFVKDLKRIRGTDNKVADFLSRIHVPDNKVSDNEDSVLLSHINLYYEKLRRVLSNNLTFRGVASRRKHYRTGSWRKKGTLGCPGDVDQDEGSLSWSQCYF
jgi:RNase H-like domain found in reverse transcriptase